MVNSVEWFRNVIEDMKAREDRALKSGDVARAEEYRREREWAQRMITEAAKPDTGNRLPKAKNP